MPVDHLVVHIDTERGPVRAGDARFTVKPGRVATSFTYDGAYLSAAGSSKIDPHLELVSGAQHVDGMPGAFQDCSPDRWGRNLISKRIRATEAREQRAARLITDIDFLIGVSDITRQGALRFTEPGDGRFLGPGTDIPRLVSLPKLVHATSRLGRNADDHEAIKQLLDAGSGSLGGARPKASVLDGDGRLLLAKFPHEGDDWDVMAWEMTALDIADEAGIPTPSRQLVAVGDRSVLLLGRFDRAPGGRRVPYVSAMTLAHRRDGDHADVTDIADAISDHGSAVAADLEQIFRRSALSCAIHNTDDHLRNVGFLGSGPGWRLAPIFDINPNPDPGAHRVTSIGAARSHADEPAGLALAGEHCRLTPAQMRSALGDVRRAARRWPEHARRNGIPESEQRRFSPSFEAGLHVIDSALIAIGQCDEPRTNRRSRRQAGERQRRPPGTPRGGEFAPTTDPEADFEF